MSELNIFTTKHGFKCHWKVTLEDMPAELVEKKSPDGSVAKVEASPLTTLTRIADRLLTFLVENDYQPDTMRGGNGAKTEPAPDVPDCPDCGGPMWDNRGSKKNPKQPDFKCKDGDCNKAIWLNKKK